MIYIFTALYYEAYIFIRKYQLVKNQENTWLQEFQNETAGIRLVITGAGEIAAAAAVASTCSIYRPTQNDLLLNVGICAHIAKPDGIFLCNKITEDATGKTFYPDMLYRHNFHEEAIVTRMLPWNGKNDTSVGKLCDMEAAAVYQAGSHFFGPHQMIFLKVVSDSGAVEEISREQTVQLMEKYQDDIFEHIRQLTVITQKDSCNKNDLHQEEERLIERFCTDLHCSKAMRDSMQQYIRYLTLAEIDYISIIEDMYRNRLLPCNDKKEGKLRFEEFKRRLF